VNDGVLIAIIATRKRYQSGFRGAPSDVVQTVGVKMSEPDTMLERIESRLKLIDYCLTEAKSHQRELKRLIVTEQKRRRKKTSKETETNVR
jgi:hypothetical protein